MNEYTCLNCAFWDEGKCRNSPPQIICYTESNWDEYGQINIETHARCDWPVTRPDDWCGKYEPRHTIQRSKTMNLYHVSQEQNSNCDTFSDFVICAPDEETARNADPSSGEPMTPERWSQWLFGWCSGPEHVAVKLIGKASDDLDPGIVCSSYIAE